MSAVPPYGSLRLAEISDLARLGTVSTAGFYHSPVFHYLRPRWKQHLKDTIASYTAESQTDILDPWAAVLVAEDEYDERESDHVFPELKAIYPSIEDQVPASAGRNGKVIVGVATVSLKANGARQGQLQPAGYHPQISKVVPNDSKRDVSQKGLKIYNRIQNPAKDRCFAGHMELTSICVHPAYRKKGHGEDLVRWFTQLADMDRIPMCVSAAPMGAKLFARLGFVEREVLELDGYDRHPGSIQLWLGLRKSDPVGGHSSSVSELKDESPS